MNLSIPELETVIAQQQEILNRLNGLNMQEWFTLEAACNLKGCNYNTTKTDTYKQPAGGLADKYLHGRKVWHKSTIIRWLSVTDDNREDYLKEILGEAVRHFFHNNLF